MPQKLEDRESRKFKAQESTFYSQQQTYNTMLDDFQKTINNKSLKQEDQEYAQRKYDETYNEKRIAIDNWKEEHGQYDEERTNERIGGKIINNHHEEEEEEEEDYCI